MAEVSVVPVVPALVLEVRNEEYHSSSAFLRDVASACASETSTVSANMTYPVTSAWPVHADVHSSVVDVAVVVSVVEVESPVVVASVLVVSPDVVLESAVVVESSVLVEVLDWVVCLSDLLGSSSGLLFGSSSGSTSSPESLELVLSLPHRNLSMLGHLRLLLEGSGTLIGSEISIPPPPDPGLIVAGGQC